MRSGIVLPALSLVCAHTLFATEDMQLRNLDSRLSALEQKQQSNAMGNPSVRPRIKKGVDFFITGDLLYWQANENGLSFVIENDVDVGLINDGRFIDPEFHWNWGYRVGLGINFCRDGWDLYANWTHLDSTAERHIARDPNGELYTILNNTHESSFDQKITASNASAHWKLPLNVFDLELGREFFTSRWLTLRPHFGARGALIPQDYHVNYSGGTSTLPGDDKVALHLNNHYWGVGLRAGLNAQWILGKDISLFGNLAAAILFGRFEIKEREDVLPLNINQLNVRHDFNSQRAVLDLAAGIRWDKGFCDDRYHAAVQLGWEEHIFFGQNQLILFTDNVKPGASVSNLGDLAFQGGTLSLMIDF